MLKWRMPMLYAVVVLLLIPTACVAQEARAFRDFHWGDWLMPLVEEHGLFKITKGSGDAGLSLWKKPDEDLIVGGTLVKSITYGFFQNRLCAVMIVHDDVNVLSELARARFGPPEYSNQFPFREAYRDGETECWVTEDNGEGVMLLGSTTLLQEYERWQKEQRGQW